MGWAYISLGKPRRKNAFDTCTFLDFFLLALFSLLLWCLGETADTAGSFSWATRNRISQLLGFSDIKRRVEDVVCERIVTVFEFPRPPDRGVLRLVGSVQPAVPNLRGILAERGAAVKPRSSPGPAAANIVRGHTHLRRHTLVKFKAQRACP